MGWNDVRISLLPEGRKLVARVDTAARTFDGSPLRILDNVAEVGASHDGRVAAVVCEELLRREGFTLKQEGPSYARMRKEEIEIDVDHEGGSLRGLCLTITLDRRSPGRVDRWQALVESLAASGGLRLIDGETLQPVEIGDFRRLLAGSRAWKEFAERWSWPPIDSMIHDHNL